VCIRFRIFSDSRLEKSNSRYAKVVELRYFGGLSIEETAEVMQASPMTVKRDWTAARAWLKQQIQPAKSGTGDHVDV
jgi:RNA polymerase sigma factor (sigma-70 family)